MPLLRDRLGEMMTLREVAGFLRVSTQTVYKMAKNRTIPAVKIGNQWRFERHRMALWLAEEGEEKDEG